MALVLAVFCLVAVVIAILLRTGLAARIAMDMPNERSLHTAPIPRIGGIVIVVATLCGWATLAEPPAATLPAALLCGLSYLDDRRGLGVVPRLGAHVAAALLFLLLLPPLPQPTALVLLVLILVWLTNLYNFMDGLDGLAAGMGLIGFATLGAVAHEGNAFQTATASYCVAAAAAGFLIFNWHPAQAFLGDAGSIPLGFLAAAFGIQGWSSGLWPLWFPLLVFSPFVADATATLLFRLLRGEKVWQAHREHYYQRLVRMGWGHRRTVLAEYALMLASSASALVLLHVPSMIQWLGLVGWAAAYLLLMRQIDAAWLECEGQ